MRYEEVDDALINMFPEFAIDDIDEGLPYCVAGSFSLYLLNSYKNNSVKTLVLAGEFIEKLYSYKDEQLDNLATVGYLEAIQNVWANNSVNPEIMFKYLGDTSRKWWVELNKFWNGEIKFIGETYND